MDFKILKYWSIYSVDLWGYWRKLRKDIQKGLLVNFWGYHIFFNTAECHFIPPLKDMSWFQEKDVNINAVVLGWIVMLITLVSLLKCTLILVILRWVGQFPHENTHNKVCGFSGLHMWALWWTYRFVRLPLTHYKWPTHSENTQTWRLWVRTTDDHSTTWATATPAGICCSLCMHKQAHFRLHITP